jgi:hypothetical protein
MTDDTFDTRVAAGSLPPLPDGREGEGDTLTRIADRLASAMTTALAARGGAGAPRVTVNIAASDAPSFRRSEAYLAGQIARAVARGQRVL